MQLLDLAYNFVYKIRSLKYRFYIKLLILFAFLSCEDLEGHGGVSMNINVAKQNKLYICEYNPIINPIIVNNINAIKIDKIWIEKQWKYDKDLKPILLDGFQMILET